MLDFIVIAENKYPIRKVAIEGYEQIFFYVSKRIAVDCSDEEVAEFVHRYMN